MAVLYDGSLPGCGPGGPGTEPGGHPIVSVREGPRGVRVETRFAGGKRRGPDVPHEPAER